MAGRVDGGKWNVQGTSQMEGKVARARSIYIVPRNPSRRLYYVHTRKASCWFITAPALGDNL